MLVIDMSRIRNLELNLEADIIHNYIISKFFLILKQYSILIIKYITNNIKVNEFIILH